MTQNTYSLKEKDRAFVLEKCLRKEITQVTAARQLGVTYRHLKRLFIKYKENGIDGIVSQRRGKPSTRQTPADIEAKIVERIQSKYSDFGPTLAHEYLTEKDGFTLSRETVRQIMIRNNIWKAKPKKTKRVHSSRPPRPARGELVQIDGSPHDWFEGRADKCTLIVFIDDATSELLNLHFAPTETTEAYMQCAKEYMLAQGRPCAFYSDKYGVFRVNTKDKQDEPTQFNRALKTLGIELICANTPQAKGRVERANQTLQDRLVKAMRLAGISSIEEANQFVKTYIKEFNEKFAKTPVEPIDAHRPLQFNEAELNHILSHQVPRKISKNLTFQFNNAEYQLEGYGKGYRLQHKTVQVCLQLDGEMSVLLDGKPLNFKKISSKKPVVEVVDSKNINDVVNDIKQKQSDKSVQEESVDNDIPRAKVAIG